jgi:hypothetical protein
MGVLRTSFEQISHVFPVDGDIWFSVAWDAEVCKVKPCAKEEILTNVE